MLTHHIYEVFIEMPPLKEIDHQKMYKLA